MTDWRELPAGDELNREIAHRKHSYGVDVTDKKKWLITYPWSENLEQAITLFADLPDNCTPRITREQNPGINGVVYAWSAHIFVFHADGSFEREFGEEAATPALAICQVWLSWKEAQS